uniref:protein-L-isoaspartate(D-aspartate) O-methyltransferase n=1 Tax=Myxobolus squamalis TaxID=59785 RepID=A0A6B2FZK3_MYXSQ
MPRCKVLEIGTGSGYLTLCMAMMNNFSGFVHSIELVQELSDNAKRNICRAGYGMVINRSIKLYGRWRYFMIIEVGDFHNLLYDFLSLDVAYVGGSLLESPLYVISLELFTLSFLK